jgi:hypothetical protein
MRVWSAAQEEIVALLDLLKRIGIIVSIGQHQYLRSRPSSRRLVRTM